MTRLDLKFSLLKSATWTPVLLKFVLKVTLPPFEHNDFDQYPLIVPQP